MTRSRCRGWRRSSTPPASRRGSRPCCPSGCATGSCGSAPCCWACCCALADHRPAHLTRVHARADHACPRPTSGRLGVTRGLEDRPAPAHLPADRAHLRPGHRTRWPRTHPTACPRSPCAAICDDLLEAIASPASTRTPARRWPSTGPTWKPSPGPPPRGSSDCADPEASWGHRSGGGPGQDSELFFGYYPSAATMMREEHGPPVPELARRMTVSLLPPRPGPRPGPGADRDARRRHPARRHPGRLRLRPPRRRRLGRPAAPGRRAAGPGPAPARPRPPRHPPRRHHRQRQPLLPGHPPHTAGTRAAGPRRHPRTRPPRTTSRPPSSPATSSAGSPATTPTATTASPAPRPRARSAARCARPP